MLTGSGKSSTTGGRQSSADQKKLWERNVNPVVHRADHSKNFTAVSNTILRETDLTLKAKGLLTVCLSLPDDWNYNIEGLAVICKEGKGAILAAVRELEEAGYISRGQRRREDGTLDKSIWDIYEIPQRMPADAETERQKQPGEPPIHNPVSDKPLTENPAAEKLHTEEPLPEDAALLNKDKQNKDLTKYRRNNRSERGVYGPFRNVFLSSDEISRLKAEFPDSYIEKINHLSRYMTSTGKEYDDHYAKICKWLREDTEKAAKEAKTARGVPGAVPKTAGTGEIKGVPYGSGVPGQHEIDAVRRLQKKHQEAAAS